MTGGLVPVDRIALSRVILVGAFALAVLADAVLRATPWGLNALVWIGALCGTVAALACWRRDAFAGASWWLVGPVLAAAAGIAWRDSPVLKGLDLLALAAILGLIGLRAPRLRLRTAGLTTYAAGIALTALNTWVESATLLAEQRLRLHARGGPFRHAPAVLRGLLIAAPLLLLFGALLAAADAVFERLILSAIGVDIGTLVEHAAVIVVLAWAIGGYLRGATGGRTSLPDARPAPPVRLGGVEVALVLGLLDLLFLAFVVVQFRYFFGGADRVETSTSLTYAEYARRGFFELCAVAALVLPLLLLLHWLLDGGRRSDQRVFRTLAGVQVALLAVIVASALQRMRLYQREYGLTELRLYTTAFMLWLAAVFLWLAATVLRGRRERFAFGLLVSGLAAIASLHALNPDALIVRTNTERAAEGRRFDARYAASLSADAVPTLVGALPRVGEADRCLLVDALRRHRSELEATDWRAWSLSRRQAAAALRSEPFRAAAAACPPHR
jgi:hypothetical protein